MKIKKVTRYYANCGKEFWKKITALEHELNCKCWNFPKNKTCKTCKFGELPPYEPDTGCGADAIWTCDCDYYDFKKHSGAGVRVDYLSFNCEYHQL